MNTIIMSNICFFHEIKEVMKNSAFTAIIESVNNKVELFNQLNDKLFFPVFNYTWEDLERQLRSLSWISQEKIQIFHNSVIYLQPTWDLSTYLSVIHDSINCDTHHITYYFSINEKEYIDKYFPGNNVIDEVERMKSLPKIGIAVNEKESMNREKLKKIFDDLGIPESRYSLWDELKTDSIILYHNYNKWEVFYLDERGGRNYFKICPSEDEACRLVYSTITGKSEDGL